MASFHGSGMPVTDPSTDKQPTIPGRNGRRTIGYLCSEIQRDFALWPWLGMVDAAGRYDVNFITFMGGILRPLNGFGGQANVLCDLAGAGCLDGLIIWPPVMGVYLSAREIEEFCRRYFPSVPVVLMQETMRGVPRVTIDDYLGCRMAVDHLIETHNYRRIAFAGMFEHHVGFKERYRAYRDSLKAHGLPMDKALAKPWFPDQHVHPSGRVHQEVFQDWVRQALENNVEAIVGISDTIALQIIETLHSLGVGIPADVAVVGFDDFKQSQVITPPLTSANPSFYELGQKAVEILLASLEGRSAPEETVVAPRLMVRQSCGCIDPAVVQAVAGPVEPKDKRLPEALAGRREEIVAEIARASGSSAGTAAWAGQLLDRFAAEASGKSPGGFLSALDEALRREMAADRDVAAWQGAVSALRRHSLPYLSGVSLTRAEDIWGQARVAIGQAAAQFQARQTVRLEHQTQIVQEISQALLSTFDADQIMNVLAGGLPRLGIPSCRLALYEDPQPYRYPQPAPEWSRLELAYDEKGRAALEPNGLRYRTSALMPEELLPRERRYSMVVEPLYFQENQLGFIILEVGPRAGSIYEALRAQISSTLQGARLVQRVHEHSAELVRQQYILGTFMENVPDPIYFKDLESRITRANKAHAVKLKLDDPAEEIGKTDFDFFPEEQARVKYAHEQEIIRTGRPILNLEEPSGIDGWALTTKMPLRDEHGRIIGTFGISHDITDLKQAQAALEKAYAEVERQVQERTTQLEHEIVERIQAEKEIQRLNAGLEKRVIERTTELETAIKELEAFTYTVSHDLRAPLRAINGYTSILADEYAPSLDANGHRICGVVRSETHRMGRLIDDLLAFSRLSRAPVRSSPIDMGGLVKSIFHEMMTPDDRRRIDFTVEALPPAMGDPILIRQVWLNLLSNAAKFSSKRERALIEVGGRRRTGENIYWVRDNGVGFEMKYANKLFNVFQRLHGEEEFEGTGVGLAIVQRLVHRHGGRVWAESEIGKGAVFYFTTPSP